MISGLPDFLHEVKINDCQCTNTNSSFYSIYMTIHYKDLPTDDGYNYLLVSIDISSDWITVLPESTYRTSCVDSSDKLEFLKSMGVLYAMCIYRDVFEDVDMSRVNFAY